MAGQSSGDALSIEGGAQVGPTFDLEGDIAGGFAGYIVQSGNIVYGGEIVVNGGKTYVMDPAAPGSTLAGGGIYNHSIVDLKGRVGYVAGTVMIYATAGVSAGKYHRTVGTATEDRGLDGLALGIGADVMISDTFFVGVEAVTRDMEHKVSTLTPGRTGEQTVRTLTLRGGLKF